MYIYIYQILRLHITHRDTDTDVYAPCVYWYESHLRNYPYIVCLVMASPGRCILTPARTQLPIVLNHTRTHTLTPYSHTHTHMLNLMRLIPCRIVLSEKLQQERISAQHLGNGSVGCLVMKLEVNQVLCEQ